MMRVALLAALLITVSLPAAANCTDEIASLTARVKTEPNKEIKGAVAKYLAAAQRDVRGSELECHNNVVRGWKVMHHEVPVGAKPLPYQMPAATQPNTPTETYDETQRRQQQPITLGTGNFR